MHKVSDLGRHSQTVFEIELKSRRAELAGAHRGPRFDSVRHLQGLEPLNLKEIRQSAGPDNGSLGIRPQYTLLARRIEELKMLFTFRTHCVSAYPLDLAT